MKKNFQKQKLWSLFTSIPQSLSPLVPLFFCAFAPFFIGCDKEPSTPQVSPPVSHKETTKLPTETFHIAGEAFEIELAFRKKTRTQGLMFRRSLDKNEGMFFVFKRSRQQSFYMKNCLVDLDILFIRHDGVIANIETMKAPIADEPLSYYHSEGPTKYALELPAGTARRLQLQPGQKIDLPARIARIIPECDY